MNNYKNFLTRTYIIQAILGSILLAVLPCLADDEEEFPPGTPLPPGYVRSIEAMTSGFTTANSLELASEYANMRHNYDQAIELAKRAIKLNDDDLDVHRAYAEALQAKIDQQKDPDPEIFNECVRQWLIVLRTERGPEKGLNKSNGKGLAWINKYYEDEDNAIPAAMHLKALVGRVPKANESDERFLAQSLKPAALNVSGKLLLRAPAAVPANDPVLWMK